MNFWEKITGSDMTKEIKEFEERAKKLPDDYQIAWEKIKDNLWQSSDFTGRNLIPIIESAIDMLEEMVVNGNSAQEALGDDIEGLCLTLVGEDGSKSFRDKCRKQLNNNIAKKLGR